jgi:hypothetical protein
VLPCCQAHEYMLGKLVHALFASVLWGRTVNLLSFHGTVILIA